jgi:transcription antitermination factor NusG
MIAWFALNVRTKAEFLVEDSLRNRCQETFLPTYIECRHYADRVKHVRTALFPGYLFCRFDPECRLPILQSPGVHHVVGDSRGPIPVHDSEIQALQRVVNSSLAVQPWPFLRSGDRVSIEFGSFAGMEGILVAQKGVHLLVLSVQLLQRSVAMQIDRAWVRPISIGPLRNEAAA